MLADRVRAQTETRQRGEKKIVDARLRLMREFERVAYSSLGDVVAWDRKPVLADDGSVQGYADELVTTPSRRLGPDKMAAIKSVTTKAGNLKIEYHDKLNAMNGLAKILGMTVDASPAPSVTVNTINIGEEKALEVARRLAFLLGNAAPAGPLIEGEAVKTGDKSE